MTDTDHWWARWSHPEHEWKRAAEQSRDRAVYRRKLDASRRRAYWLRVAFSVVVSVALAVGVVVLLMADGWRSFF